MVWEKVTNPGREHTIGPFNSQEICWSTIIIYQAVISCNRKKDVLKSRQVFIFSMTGS